MAKDKLEKKVEEMETVLKLVLEELKILKNAFEKNGLSLFDKT